MIVPLMTPPAIVAQAARPPVPAAAPSPAAPDRATLKRDADKGDLESAASLFYLDVDQKRWDEALVYGGKYLAAHPENDAFAVDYASALINAGKIDQARALISSRDAYLHAHPENAGILSDLFYAYSGAKRNDQAVPMGREYLALHPENDAFAIDYAYALMALDKVDDARAVVSAHEAYITAHPEAAGIYADLFYALNGAKQTESAVEFGKKYIASHPAEDAFAIDLAYAEMDLGRVGDVRELLLPRESYLKAHTDAAAIWEDIATRDADRGNYRLAMTEMDRYLRIKPADKAAKQQRQSYYDDIYGGPRLQTFGSAQYETRFKDGFFGLDSTYALAPAAAIQPYFAVHGNGDVRSGPPGSQQIFADNSLISDLGLHAHLGPFTYIFVEGGNGVGLRGQGDVPDFRYGLQFSDQWGSYPHASTVANASAAVYSRYGGNLISYYSVYHLVGGKFFFHPIFGFNAGVDTQRVFGNSFIEGFVGAQLGTPFVYVRAEEVKGSYLTRGVPDQTGFYANFRGQLIFTLTK